MNRHELLEIWFNTCKEYRQCEECKQTLQVAFVPDPYTLEMYNETKEEYVCLDCFINQCERIEG